jgi:hypothetical protein
MIRKNMSTQEDRMMKLRTDYIANKRPTDDEAYFLAVHKALKGEAAAARF